MQRTARTAFALRRSALRAQYRPFSASFRTLHDTPLEKLLEQSIRATGPLTVAHYIKSCLAHPVEGYYMKGDVFGTKGDFTTSPEISQTFGEITGIWLASRWLASQNASPIRLVELGPGRGTLMEDILRTFRSLKALRDVPISVHLVETSEQLREIQKTKLCPPGSPLEVVWYDDVSDIPASTSPTFTMVVAHELFDALPIHIIEKSEAGFSEVLVGRKETATTRNPDSTVPAVPQSGSPFRFVKSPIGTAGAELLAASSPRFRNAHQMGRIEVSPDGWRLARSLGELISQPGGGAGLIVDYGDDHYFGDSFRAYRKHKAVDVFDKPGSSDLTANVDFAYLREAIEPVARTLGPIKQHDFLLRMGLDVRVSKLVKNAQDPARKKDIAEGAERLVSLTGMGSEYKIMGIVPKVPESVDSSESVVAEDVYPFTS